MQDMVTVESNEAPEALGPYAQAVRCGDIVYCSGQVGLDPVSGELVAGGIDAQTEQALHNLAAVLAAAGSSISNVLKTTVYLADLSEFGAMNAVYAAAFGEHRPARATVQVARLPRDARVEIDCVAAVSRDASAGGAP